MLPEKLGFSIISLKNYIGANTLMTWQETFNLPRISISFILKKIHQSKPVGRTIIREPFRLVLNEFFVHKITSFNLKLNTGYQRRAECGDTSDVCRANITFFEFSLLSEEGVRKLALANKKSCAQLTHFHKIDVSYATQHTFSKVPLQF